MEEEDDINVSNQQGGGINSNDQIGLINVNAQTNLNLNFANSGGATASASLVSGTTLASIVPVVGQIISIGLAVISVIQVIDTAQKQIYWQEGIKYRQEAFTLAQQEISLIDLEYQNKLDLLNEEIEYREEVAKTNKLLLVGTMGILGVSAMVLAYSVIKLKSK